ncbi:MAG TPA: hypothetical protein VFX45_12085 [Solirubrobacterales bacterium]|nr:hypothetical protein [Solirubrobacterales bacterium]
MKARKSVAGAFLLCALLLSALAAQGASAAGTTAFTCASAGGVGPGFSKEHCKPADAVQSGANFKHVAIANGTTTELNITNANTNAETNAATTLITKATVAGLPLELTSTGVSGSGTITNTFENEEHIAHGTVTFTTTGVIAHNGCRVFTDSAAGTGEEGVIHTEPLKFTTKGQGHNVKFEPVAGNVIKRFELTDCPMPALNGTYTVTGSYTCPLEGATIVCSHAATTTQNTLKLNGAIKMGIAGSLTPKARANSTEAYKPISFTTT